MRLFKNLTKNLRYQIEKYLDIEIKLINDDLYKNIETPNFHSINYLIYGMFYGLPIICLIPFVSVTIRRIHDIGQSGFVILIFFILFCIIKI